MIEETHKKLIAKEITSSSLVKESLIKSEKIQVELNPFVTILEAKEQLITDSYLSGIPCAIKDNISTKKILTTASSNSLKNYIPSYDATVIEKLKENNAVIIGKTVLDELAIGATGTTGHTGIVKNPWDKTRICGGSSAGSACLVASGVVPYSLGSDTGDSVRKPAAYCGVVGYKPTYGMISRYGLFAFASSLDHIGVFSRSVKDAAIVVDAIKGKDVKDMTTWDSNNISLFKSITGKVKGKKLFYIKEICDINTYNNPSLELKKVLAEFNNTIKVCQEIGIEVYEESIDERILNALYPTYLCISCAEATSNDSCLTGISYGPRNEGKGIIETIKNHRTLNFSSLIKRRFIIGSYVLQKENQEKYFKNAGRVRKLVVEKMNELFKIYDGLILPCSGGVAPKINDTNNKVSLKNMVLENHLCIGNFGGFPSITIPNEFINNLPIGINITGKIKDDENVLNIAAAIESKMSFKGQIAEVK